MIREILPEDIASLLVIEKACFEAGYDDHMNTAEDFEDGFADPDVKIFVCIEDSEVAGYASLFLEDVYASFDSLAVSPTQQGKGLGEQLFKFIESYCQTSGFPQLNLEIKETNYALLKRYHRFGYKCFEVETGFYADGWGAIRMLKRFE
jgi:[ribosomal protein S18]-alanine N-acetyltransferase